MQYFLKNFCTNDIIKHNKIKIYKNIDNLFEMDLINISNDLINSNNKNHIQKELNKIIYNKDYNYINLDLKFKENLIIIDFCKYYKLPVYRFIIYVNCKTFLKHIKNNKNYFDLNKCNFKSIDNDFFILNDLSIVEL